MQKEKAASCHLIRWDASNKMKRQIIIEKNALTIQTAIVEQGKLIGFYIDDLLEKDLQNQIVMGQVMQVVKNLKAVFVDYGDERNGMLHLKQIPAYYASRVQVGSRLPVQIVKQNIGEKGHKLTAKLNLTGRYLVCLPFEPGINISKKITDVQMREEMKAHLSEVAADTGYGFIVRTHGSMVPLTVLVEEAKYLIQQANSLLQSKDYLTKGTCLYEAPTLTEQVVIEQLMGTEEIEVVCNNKTYLEALEGLLPQEEGITRYFTHYQEDLSIWSIYGIQKQVDSLLKRKVWLKNGGNLIIDYTEAMTIIDVNSAKAVLTKNPEKAVLNLNLEAVQEGILQILGRNLSGMIIMDLVEMKQAAHKAQVYEWANTLLKQYHDQRTKVYPLTELGLLQFSRTKKYQCLPHQLLTIALTDESRLGQKSFLYDMMQLEQKLRQVKLEAHKQEVYVTVMASYEEKMRQMGIIELLEAAYPVRLHLKKVESQPQKNILCQFYQK